METACDDPTAEGIAFAELLLDSGLVSEGELALAQDETPAGGRIDSILITQGLVKSAALRRVMGRSWHLAVVNLARTHIDRELVDQWPTQTYLTEGWFPVRDQANGSVLVATCRRPESVGAERIAALIAAPIEFAIATSVDIAAAADRVAKGRSRMLRLFRS